jgi:L,D-transpeptidase catalytic domain/Putative peptidoglycan binding domain
MARGRHITRAARKRWPLVVGAVAVLLVLSVGGAAYAAYRYELAHADRILPGVRVGGVDVSEMTEAEAMAAVWRSADTGLDRELTVFVGGKHLTVSARELGRRAYVRKAVHQAFEVSERLGWITRAWHRLRDSSIDRSIPLRIAGDSGVDGFVRRTAKEVFVEPRDASIGLTDGVLSFHHAKAGRALDVGRAAHRLRNALANGSSIVRLRMRPVAPQVTADTLGPTIVVHVDTNRLDLYEGFNVQRSYDVATAKPGYVTPDGEWTIYRKAENPTWYNPALDSWGADLPAVIPGGPGNPMGTRALYITAPGLIRIHGTSTDSSIGRYASHGCIRMHNWEIEQLYELVPVGTRVIIVGTRPSWAVEGDFPDTPDGSDTVA